MTPHDAAAGRRIAIPVLTAEVLLPLGYLPRSQFLGQVVSRADGAEAARALLVDEIEDLRITLLPDQTTVGPAGLVVQPDAVMVSSRIHVLVEAKRIAGSSFQPEQLSREYLALMQDAKEKTPLLLLLLGSPPPVSLRGLGRFEVVDAVRLHLRSVHARTGLDLDLQLLDECVEDRVAWITWHDITDVVAEQARLVAGLEPSVSGTVQRLAASVTDAIRWHESAPKR